MVNCAGDSPMRDAIEILVVAAVLMLLWLLLSGEPTLLELLAQALKAWIVKAAT